jgi:hypothetical protein
MVACSRGVLSGGRQLRHPPDKRKDLARQDHSQGVCACEALSNEVAARASGLASGLALAVRPEGRQRLRRSRAGPEDPFCEAVRKDLRVPLTLEGPPRTMRGDPARHCDRSPGDRRTWREQHGPAGPRGRGHRGRVAEGTGRLRGAGAANRRQRRARWASARRARQAAAPE